MKIQKNIKQTLKIVQKSKIEVKHAPAGVRPAVTQKMNKSTFGQIIFSRSPMITVDQDECK